MEMKFKKEISTNIKNIEKLCFHNWFVSPNYVNFCQFWIFLLKFFFVLLNFSSVTLFITILKTIKINGFCLSLCIYSFSCYGEYNHLGSNFGTRCIDAGIFTLRESPMVLSHNTNILMLWWKFITIKICA